MSTIHFILTFDASEMIFVSDSRTFDIALTVECFDRERVAAGYVQCRLEIDNNR